jgi:MSHA biogenesis protein MshK
MKDEGSSFVRCLVMVGGLVMVGAASSQGMSDPTRPPAGFAAGDPEAATEAGGPVLQSVMISSRGRAAIISGEVVRLGQKYRDAVLVRVAENEVVLKGGGGTQVLKLYPGVEKRDIAPAAAKPAPRRGKGRQAGDPAAAGSGSPR